MNGALLGLAAVFCLLVVVALIALLTVVSKRRGRRRWSELHHWAQFNDWSLTARPGVDWGSRLPGGNKHGVSLALHGRLSGRPTSIGEYSYSETSTMGRTAKTTTH